MTGPMHKTRLVLALAVAASLLAGCKSDEEKAAEFFASAQAYLEQNDVDRALVELRNVFQHDGFHHDARATYARLLLDRGDVPGGYGQLLRLVEQYPEDVDARETLAHLALSMSNWDEARRHGDIAIRLAPERIGVRAIAATLAYRDAVLARDDAARDAAADEARAVLGEDPDQIPARQVLIDVALVNKDYDAAMSQVELALDSDPTRLDFHKLKADLLSRKGDTAAVGAQLQEMYERFPENEDVGNALIRWFLMQRDFDGAVAFLQGKAGADDSDPELHLPVINLLRTAKGPEAARAELDRLIAANEGSPNAGFYTAVRAALDFDAGERDAAIATIEGVLKGAEPSDQTRKIKVMLAQMLGATGDSVGARARIEEVLAEDASNVAALKMRAARLIQEDQPGAAVIDLRTALDQQPRDTDILALMAEAHLRDGSPELAQERLALAVEISGKAPKESLNYARFLLGRDRPELAETVLTDARNTTPGNFEVLAMLGEVFLRNQKWPQAQVLVDELRQFDTPQAAALARNYQAAILMGQNKVDDSLAFLREGLTGEETDQQNLPAVLQILRTQVMAGRAEEARAYLDGLLAEEPESLPLRLISANLDALTGNLEAAEAAYRALIEERPDMVPAVLQLYALLSASGQPDAADAVIDAGLEAQPNARQLLLLDAYGAERAGDPEAAIAIYQKLYDANSNDVIVANNLASMISMHRDSPEDLEAAYAIARRLNDSDVPAFRDTIGWIRYLRGETRAAIEDLEVAAKGLPEDPSVAFHLGLAYAKDGQTEKAKATLQRGLELAGDRDVAQRKLAADTLAGL